MIAFQLPLKARLMAAMGFIALVLVASGAAITVYTRSHLIGQVDSRLETLAAQLGGPRAAPGSSRLPFPDSSSETAITPPPIERPVDLYLAFLTPGGTRSAEIVPNVGEGAGTVPEIQPDQLPQQGQRTFTAESRTGDVAYRVLAMADAAGTQITAIPFNNVEETLATLLRVEIVTGLVVLGLLALVAWWVIRLGIRPINEMSRIAERIAAGDRAVRIPETAPGTESGQLAIALNQMLASIDDALEQRAEAEQRTVKFVADASHELRTPITTIRGYAELYRSGGLQDAEELADAMRRTELEAARMGRLVDDMLTLAKFDQRRPLRRRPVDLRELVADAVRDARAVTPGRPIHAEQPAKPIVVVVDDDLIRQVFANVIGNAQVHTAADVPISIRLDASDGVASLEVVDAGQGIPTEMLDHVTERFVRVDGSRSRHTGGSGLGLSIATATVDAHGGTVVIESEPSRGTTVRISIPTRSSSAN